MKLLSVSVLASAVCLVAGLAALLLTPASAAVGLLDAGIIVLMAIPVVRVVLAIAEFARARDWLFVATAVTVLVFLGISLFYSVRSN